MTKLSIPDMTCGHCKAAVEGAILKIDPAASVAVDLASHTAEVTSTEPSQALINALVAAGFPASEM